VRVNLSDYKNRILVLSRKKSKVHTLNIPSDADTRTEVDKYCKENEVSEIDTIVIIKG